ncbi:RNA methyltransferase [Acidaminobacter sp. JC074]|uniref:TrmH family RNA methyltransferase n=1 Tax=Acidaminobacter sp. JC074 TaxID=2530199 RepID=UPI001F10D98B|nr:RNA methyltransferase [Acidaminobacter sp. JC074]MCH4888474.1 RNA methyltransferase [Acidaminobacter sp. JC074]
MKISKDVYEVSKKTMERLTSKEGQTDLVMICKKIKVTSSLKKILVLDGLESPGNIGTIFRSCDGAGFDGIFIVNQRARINQYKVVKASMGGYFNIPHRSFDSVKNLADYLMIHNYKIILANPSDKSQKNKPEKLALVVGNERYGLSKEWFDYHHQTISIPMKGFCDSLNVGVAASILMYEIIKGVQ